MEKKLKYLSWTVTAIFVLTVVAPLMLEKLSITYKNRNVWHAFSVKDEAGRLHTGWFGGAKFYDNNNVDMFDYAYEAPEGSDLSHWENRIYKVDPAELKNKDGFIFSNRGFLWADGIDQGSEGQFFSQGSRLDTEADNNIHVGDFDEPVLYYPGAPFDVLTKNMSMFGKYPDYQLEYEHSDFTFRLNYLMNDGKLFRNGDMGAGTMQTLPTVVTGSIIHKKTGKAFNVRGFGLMQNCTGHPWSWLDWGYHDYMHFNFADGWAGGFWKGRGDWQWGYSSYPEIGWIYNPERKEYQTLSRLEMVSTSEEIDENRIGASSPRRGHWILQQTRSQ